MTDIVRVLRLVEYTGPRDKVERQVERSIQGVRVVGSIAITAVTVGTFAHVLDNETAIAALHDALDRDIRHMKAEEERFAEHREYAARLAAKVREMGGNPEECEP